MPWRVTHLADYNIIETTYTGEVTIEELQAAIMMNLKLASQYKSRLYLGDCSGIRHQSSIQEMRELAGYIQHISADPQSKEAIILPISQKLINEIRDFDFPSHGKHYQFDIFSSRRKAIAWLIS